MSTPGFEPLHYSLDLGSGLYEVEADIAGVVACVHDEAHAALFSASPKLLAVAREIAILGPGKCSISKALSDTAREAVHDAMLAARKGGAA